MYESFFALFFDLAIEMNERERVLNFCSSRTRKNGLVFGFLYENEKESVFLYTNALMCCV
jgi:hypothetical protein